jgi:hypothetical protein
MHVHINQRAVQVLGHVHIQYDEAGAGLLIPEKVPAALVALLHLTS